MAEAVAGAGGDGGAPAFVVCMCVGGVNVGVVVGMSVGVDMGVDVVVGCRCV